MSPAAVTRLTLLGPTTGYTLGLNVEGSATPGRPAGNLHVLYDFLSALSYPLVPFYSSLPSLVPYSPSAFFSFFFRYPRGGKRRSTRLTSIRGDLSLLFTAGSDRSLVYTFFVPIYFRFLSLRAGTPRPLVLERRLLVSALIQTERSEEKQTERDDSDTEREDTSPAHEGLGRQGRRSF